MKKVRHLFVYKGSQLLPRWREAFPDAIVARADSLNAGIKCDIVWLCIESGITIANQLAQVRQHVGAVKCVVLSDQPDDEQALAAFAAAARGYCNMHATAAVLKQVESVVLQGGLWIGESLMQRVLVATTQQLATVNQAQDDSWCPRGGHSTTDSLPEKSQSQTAPMVPDARDHLSACY